MKLQRSEYQVSKALTPSQRRAINTIRYLIRHMESPQLTAPVAIDEVEVFNETGLVYYTISTSRRFWESTGGLFKIGKRGRIEIMCVDGWTLEQLQTAELYQFRARRWGVALHISNHLYASAERYAKVK